MKYQEIIGNLIDMSLLGSFDVIAHGCNSYCRMGNGVAPQMAEAFGCDNFTLETEQYRGDINKLGQIQYQKYSIKNNIAVATNLFKSDLTVINCYTQYMYGKNHTDGVSSPLDYEALTLCLRKINHIFKGKRIGLPGFIGGGLAGGNIDIIRSIIQKELKDMDVTIVFLEQNKYLMLNGE